MASVFTKIIQGELPCFKIHEDELTLSILTIEPVALGHTLVITKQEINSWLDVPQEIYSRLHHNSQVIGRAILKATGCPRVGQIVAGFEVPHYHLHLIPAWSIPDLSFARAKKRSQDEMVQIQNEILKNLGPFK
jgi:histidine triad (HIT) family protein